MSNRTINGKDAMLYIENVDKHSIEIDVQWLIETGRFPVGCKVLDVGCGTGKLIFSLTADNQYARSVRGVELSSELAKHAQKLLNNLSCIVYQKDFLDLVFPDDWCPDTIVMSFFLHHCDDITKYLKKAFSLLPHGGRLYIMDRIAVDEQALNTFPKFWEEHYKQAHEWDESIPNITTIQSLTDKVSEMGFDFVKKTVSPYDHRPGTNGYPKTMMEFWKHQPKQDFPAILIISPAHQEFISEIISELSNNNLNIKEILKIEYKDDLIRTFYSSAPWKELLVKFVHDICPESTATALYIEGDYSKPDLLKRISNFKTETRDKWQSFSGEINNEGFRPMILPFHVPEPFESELLARVIKNFIKS